MKNKRVYFIIFSFLFFLFSSHSVHAVCPVCTVAVGACVGLAQYLGIDDTITGIWVGGLLVSVIIWTISWFDKKNIRFPGRKILIISLIYAISIAPLYFQGIIGHPFNKFLGMDKLVLGIIAGSILFIAAVHLNKVMKDKNGGKVYFPFQKVVFPVAALLFISGIFYLITC